MGNRCNCDIKVLITEDKKTFKQFSSENVLGLLFDDFDLSDYCSSDNEFRMKVLFN